MVKKAMLLLVLSALAAYSAGVNYPYPQRVYYGNGTINAQSATASANLKGKFLKFMEGFYEEGNCNGTKDCARIKFDTPEHTVSEGIGYAMIMMVYFSDEKKSYQAEFDKLWEYYKKWQNGNGVMNWKINGFASVNGQNGATDAELDAAIALVMARYQFGDEKYETAAKALIKIIREKELSSDGLLKPGDNWEADRNPSYVSPAAFEIFKDLDDGTSPASWSTALTRNYTFLKANQNSTTGLPSGWANPDGSRKTCSNSCGITTIAYDQDAVRAPWRWAWANAWFGHADAKTLLSKLGTWVNGKDPGSIKGPINDQSGAMGEHASSGYIGSLMCALTGNLDYQSSLNSYWSTLLGNANESYYNQALQVLFGLLVSGNMPNLKACNSNGCGEKMPSIGGGDNTPIDKFANAQFEQDDEKGYAGTWDPWFAYTDAASNGTSTITNAKFQTLDENNNCESIDSYRVVMEDAPGSGEWVAKIPSYTLLGGGGNYKKDPDINQYAPFVALGLDANGNLRGDYDLSLCSGVSYKYKGQPHNFKVQTTSVPKNSGADYFILISDTSANWTDLSIDFEIDLKQPTWASTAQKVDFKRSEIYNFIWELKGHDNGADFATPGISANTGSLAIKDFNCLGKMYLPDSRKVSPCVAPINKPAQFAKTSKAMQPIKNGVSLQVVNSATLEIYNLKGKLLQKQVFANGTWSVQLNDLPKGLYIVKAQIGSNREILQLPIK